MQICKFNHIKMILEVLDVCNKFQQVIKDVLESKYFLLLVSVLTIINYYFKLGICTYVETAIFLILMIVSNSQFLYLPSIVIFILGGGLTTAPNYKSFSFVLLCISGVLLVGFVIYFVVKKRKELVCITLSNSLVLTTILLVVGMLLSMITSIKPLTTLGAIGGFLVNLVVMYFVLTTVKNDDEKKEKLAQSFVAIFYVIFIMILIEFFKLLSDHNIKELLFNKGIFKLSWAHSNHYCAILSICSIFSLYLFISTFSKTNMLKKIFYIFPTIGTLLLSIFIVSRGPLFGLCAAISVAYILTIIEFRKNKKTFITLSTIAVVGICFIMLLYLFVIKDAFGDKGLNGRQEIWPVAWRYFKENWFLGTGYGTQRIFIIAETSQTVYNYHNYFLQISTCGIVGIIAFIIYLVNIGWHCINKLNWFNITFIAIFALFLTNGFVDTLFFSNKIMPLFSICLCYLDLKPKEVELAKYWDKLDCNNKVYI